MDNDDENQIFQEAENLDQVEEPEIPHHDQLSDYQLARDRERRNIRANPKYISYVELIYIALLASFEVQGTEPDSYRATMKSKDRDKWLEAMKEEMNSLLTNHTWSLVKRPEIINWWSACGFSK